jgi:hypothetical protein
MTEICKHCGGIQVPPLNEEGYKITSTWPCTSIWANQGECAFYKQY